MQCVWVICCDGNFFFVFSLQLRRIRDWIIIIINVIEIVSIESMYGAMLEIGDRSRETEASSNCNNNNNKTLTSVTDIHHLRALALNGMEWRQKKYRNKKIACRWATSPNIWTSKQICYLASHQQVWRTHALRTRARLRDLTDIGRLLISTQHAALSVCWSQQRNKHRAQAGRLAQSIRLAVMCVNCYSHMTKSY